MKILVDFTPIVIAIALSHYLINFVQQLSIDVTNKYIEFPSNKDFDGNILIVLKLACFHSIFLLAQVFFIGIARLFSSKININVGEDPKLIQNANIALSNSVINLVMFVPQFTFLLFSKKIKAELVFAIGLNWLFWRVAFFVGFLVGSAFKMPSFRFFGFLNSTIVMVHLALKNFELDYLDCFFRTA